MYGLLSYMDLYIILHGHLTPGGGFGGGVIIALALLNVMLAYGKEFTLKWLNIQFLHRLEGSSVILFMIVGSLGIFVGGGFLANIFMKGELFRLLSAGTIPLLNILIGIISRDVSLPGCMVINSG